MIGGTLDHVRQHLVLRGTSFFWGEAMLGLEDVVTPQTADWADICMVSSKRAPRRP